MVSESIFFFSISFSSYSPFIFSTRVLSTLFIFSLAFLLHLLLFLFHLVPKISGRDLLLVEESCNVPRPIRQVPSSYSSLLPCNLLACCILPCHHLHFIYMFFKTCIRSGSPGSLRCSFGVQTTLARARGTSEILFYKWHKNVLGMGCNLSCGLIIV